MNKYQVRRVPLCLAIGTVLATEAAQASITVNSAADAPIGTYASDCTLRAAIAAANTDAPVDGCAAGQAGLDDIVFDQQLANSTITLAAGELEISSPVRIIGPEAGDPAGMIIDGNGASRIFNITATAPGEFEVGFDSLTLTGGHTTADYARGGAVNSLYADLSLANTLVTGNSTDGNNSHGGGLSVYFGNATLNNCTVSENSTAGYYSLGGGLAIDFGNVTVDSSTISGNSTTGELARGGGLSVIYGDTAVRNSTLTGNFTQGDSAPGGGLNSQQAEVTLTHVTVANNSAADGADAIHRLGGTLSLNNSLVVQANAGETACNQPASSQVNSLATDQSCSGVATDLTEVALEPLADNGGPTLTHALMPNSVAIDAAGDCASDFDILIDQRGMTRGMSCDIGAFEFIDTVFEDRFESGDIQ